MTAVTVIDDTGADVDWRVRQACLARIDLRSELDDGVPENLTGVTISARITASSTSTVALKTPTVTLTAATAGQFSVVLSDTANDLAPGTYWWALEIDTGDGDVPLMSGRFIVEDWVIR